MELNFDSGVREYTVHGVKGDVTIRFNPTDGAFIQKLYDAFNTIDKKQEQYADEVRKCGDRVEIFIEQVDGRVLRAEVPAKVNARSIPLLAEAKAIVGNQGRVTVI